MIPTLYVKTGCPYCKAATDYLDQHKVAYEVVDVRGNDSGMKKLQELSGQTNTPTMDWDGQILADFGTDQLEKFVASKQGQGEESGQSVQGIQQDFGNPPGAS